MSTSHLGHYTTPTGLMGIVRGTIWATNIRYLNDDQEFKHAVALVKDLLSKSIISKGHPDYARKEVFVDELTKKLASIEFIYPDYIFTASFSEKTDLLSQWRGYCPSNNGYCISIDIEGLVSDVQERFKKARLLKCVYDDNEKSKQIKELLNRFWRKYKNSSISTSKMLDSLTPELLILASHFKHSSFAEEAEHRIVVELNGNEGLTNFRDGKYSITPYIELPVEKRHIKSICIGPTSRPELANSGLTAFLEKEYAVPSFLLDVNITHSQTPYRP